jgi:hypothetical protein
MKKSYRSPVQDLSGYTTFTNQQSQQGLSPTKYEYTSTPEQDSAWDPSRKKQMRESPSALPLPDRQKKDRVRKVGPTTYNNVDRKPDGNSPKLNNINWRTIPEEGSNYGHPTKYDYNYPTRRVNQTRFSAMMVHYAEMVHVGVPKLPSPGKRQNKLRSQEKIEKAKDYKVNRNVVLRERKQHYRQELKNDPNRDRYQRLYRKYPNRFKRTKTSPYGSAAERTKAWRQEEKQEAKRKGLTQEELAKKRKKTAEDWGIWYKRTYPPENPDAISQRVPNFTGRPQPGLKGAPPKKNPGIFRKVKNVPSAGSSKVIPLWSDKVNRGQPVPQGVPRDYLRNQEGVKMAMVDKVAQMYAMKVWSGWGSY